MFTALALSLAAIANRCWGAKEGERWVAILLFSLAWAIAKPELALWFPVVALGFWIFRLWATGPWLENTEGRDFIAGIIRGIAVIPLGVFALLVLDGNAFFITFYIIPFIYYFAYKISPPQCVEMAELCVGAWLLGVIL